MEKYAVVTNQDHEKLAADGVAACPKCGSRKVNHNTLTPHCPSCGTEPWEKHASRKKENYKDRR